MGLKLTEILIGTSIGTVMHERVRLLAACDYCACMMLIACSSEDFAIGYLSNDLTTLYVRKYRTEELLFLCDLLCGLKDRSYLNGVINLACYYFFLERKNQIIHKYTRLKESEMQCAKSEMKELEKAVFRLKVDICSYRTFGAEELAEMCGMSYSLFRTKFRKYYGMPAADWLISNIKMDMTHHLEFSIKEIAQRNTFPSASNFADFCNQ